MPFLIIEGYLRFMSLRNYILRNFLTFTVNISAKCS